MCLPRAKVSDNNHRSKSCSKRLGWQIATVLTLATDTNRWWRKVSDCVDTLAPRMSEIPRVQTVGLCEGCISLSKSECLLPAEKAVWYFSCFGS